MNKQDQTEETYLKGELVPAAGVYRCCACGEVWETDQDHVRFPPCEANKTGEARWHLMRAAEEARE